MAEIERIIEQLEQLKFFNQRAGRELWNIKPTNIQNEDINNAEKKLDEAIQTIRELQEQNKWHLCSEELPTESNYYLARIYNADVDDCDYRKTWFAHGDDYDGESEWRELQSYEDVIAWRELPKFEVVE